MIIFLKAILGAVVMVAISLISRTKNYYIAGLVPLFPTFTIIAHYTVGVERSNAELRNTVLFSIWSVIPYMIYLVSFYYLTDIMSMKAALLCSVTLWCISAAILLLFWTNVK